MSPVDAAKWVHDFITALDWPTVVLLILVLTTRIKIGMP